MQGISQIITESNADLMAKKLPRFRCDLNKTYYNSHLYKKKKILLFLLSTCADIMFLIVRLQEPLLIYMYHQHRGVLSLA